MKRDLALDEIPVFLNVYDLSFSNNYLYSWGFGIYHSAVEVLGKEFAFGYHPYDFSGAFAMEPRSLQGAIFREAVIIGTAKGTHFEIRKTIEAVARQFPGNSYSMIHRNCNHFSDALCQALCGKAIPNWVNRMAFYGKLLNCVVPESILLGQFQPNSTGD